jgi:anti-sigma B factor antagonist
MRSASRPVVVARMPRNLDHRQARRFYKDVQPLLKSHRPQIVFDMSETEQMDSMGLDVLLLCLHDVIESDGEVKLAGVRPSVSVLLELSRIGLLFGIYENSVSAAKSFSSFVPNASPYQDPSRAHAAMATADAVGQTTVTGTQLLHKVYRLLNQ